MAQLSGKKLRYVTKYYENYICMDNLGNRFFIKPEDIELILMWALKNYVFTVKKKKVRTWLTIKKVKTK